MGNIEWFCSHTSVKNQQYAVGCGGIPEVDWRDKCGVYAALKSDHLKRMADLLASPDNKTYQDAMDLKLQRFALDQIAADGVELRCQSEQSIEHFVLKMARLVRWLYQYDAEDQIFKRAGKLRFAAIKMQEGAYKATWLKYEQKMAQNLRQWEVEIDAIIGEYRRNMRSIA